jgi:parallel beta-helix repeat protein
MPIISSIEPQTSNIIYVDDDGGADYTRIQDAIDNASIEDTIYVYSGVYNENLIIDKRLTLQGENRETTIIDGMGKNHCIIIKKFEVWYWDKVQATIQGFTIQNRRNNNGIRILQGQHRIEILNNIIQNCSYGIVDELNSFLRIEGNIIRSNRLDGINIHGYASLSANNSSLSSSSLYLIIRNNIISGNLDGIDILWEEGYIIRENRILNNENGIFSGGYECQIVYNELIDNTYISIYFSGDSSVISNNYITTELGMYGIDIFGNSNQVIENYIENHFYGIYIFENENLIYHNKLHKNSRGITLSSGQYNIIKENEFRDNFVNFEIQNSIDGVSGNNQIISNNFYLDHYNNNYFLVFTGRDHLSNNWNANFWGRPRIRPKMILGITYLTNFIWSIAYIFRLPFLFFIYIPLITFDLHPAFKSYDIPPVEVMNVK